MALQYSVNVRNAQLDAVESTTGTAARLQLRTGSPPADCATAASGTLLMTMVLPSDWMAAASSGSKALTGTWIGNAVAAGDVGHFRIYNSGVTTCHVQGTVTATGGGGDMTIDNITLAINQGVNVTAFTISAGNA